MTRTNRAPRVGAAARSEAMGAKDPRARRGAQAETQTHHQFGEGITLDKRGRPSVQADATVLEIGRSGLRLRSQGQAPQVSDDGTENATALREVVEVLRRAGLVT